MLRRLNAVQPERFAFTPANLAWAEAQIAKYPPGRQASAIIPLLWRAQEQEGWLSRPAIEHVAAMLGMPYIRALEVATFYFMFQLSPVGSVAHIQVCGTTTCMICGAEDLVAVCRDRIAAKPHVLSADGKFSWEEVECLGSCANAPMAQIGKDYYEDLTAERLRWILDELEAGRVPQPGPQNGRYASEPLGGPTTLKDHVAGRDPVNASVRLALDIGDTVKKIDGTEVPLVAPWLGKGASRPEAATGGPGPQPAPGAGAVADSSGITVEEAPAMSKAKPVSTGELPVHARPAFLETARDGGPDDLTLIRGIGPKLAGMLHGMGIHHFDQIAGWTAAELAWVDANLEGFRGRASRDDWVGQARNLTAPGADTPPRPQG